MDNDFDLRLDLYLLIILVAIVFFVGGMVVGSNYGMDIVADDWCISLGYGMGEYDNDMDNVVCTHVEIMEGE